MSKSQKIRFLNQQTKREILTRLSAGCLQYITVMLHRFSCGMENIYYIFFGAVLKRNIMAHTYKKYCRLGNVFPLSSCVLQKEERGNNMSSKKKERKEH